MMMGYKKLRVFLCCLVIFSLFFTGMPFISNGGIQTAYAANSTVTQSGNVWTLENDVMKSVVSFAGGSIQMTSFNLASKRQCVPQKCYGQKLHE
jgi:hypothetical protein